MERMEEYYVEFKEKLSIHAEAQFEVDSLKNAFPDIYDHIGIVTWVHSPYLLTYIFKNWCGNSMLYTGPGNSSSGTRAAQIHFHSNHRFGRGGYRTVRADGMITLATNTNKDSPAMKRAKCTTRKTSPPPLASSTTSTAQFHPTIVHAPTPSDFLNIAQRAQEHESRVLNLAKAIPSMIQNAIKKVLQPAKDKLKSLCSTVEVLENEAIVDDDIFEWEMEEEVVGELIADVFLKGEELEEEKRSIHAKAQFEVDSFKNSFPDINDQIGMCDWGPYTILVDPYFSELVWEFYASYKARKQLLKHKGRIDTLPCLPSIWVRGIEVPITPEKINSLYWVEPIQLHLIFRKKVENKGNQFQWVANMISLGQPQGAISRDLIYHRDLNFEAHIWTVPADSIITLSTKTDKAASAMKRAKCTTCNTSPSASSTTSTSQFHLAVVHALTPPDLLKIAQRAKEHEIHILKLGKAIPSMIQTSIKKVLQPAKDELKSVCSTVEVLENEVISLREEVSALDKSPSTRNANPPEPAAVSVQLEAPKSPPDD
ncbi:hypothetical protein HAX54_016627 [Datura stramonium]|uniref:Uncharacterized protein n=1 Tax=Datura stramonium TaxID=4076 RepID=A0ABS8S0D9_DATST|nr:hypothetical protein [Datura stramonium]